MLPSSSIMAPTHVAFDLYGTLLSTESIQKELAQIYGEDRAKTVASLARRYQLEYTWRANSMGKLARWSLCDNVSPPDKPSGLVLMTTHRTVQAL